MAFVVRGSKRQLFYCPDIDEWQSWQYDLRTFVTGMNVALLDGCFYSADELPDRDLGQIPHPLVKETVKRIKGVACEVRFIHLNHSNPLLKANSAEQAWLTKQGFDIGRFGERWQLG
jgi:pyrroloquinoline quinone biosynthesis protein B